MITIISQPSAGAIVAAYVPILYSVRIRESTANVPPVLEATVSINGTEYAAFQVPYLASEVVGSDMDYFFDVDASEIVRDALRDVIAIPPRDSIYFNREPLTSVQIEFSGWYDNGFGSLVQDTENTEPGEEIFAINAYRKAQESPLLTAYTEDVRQWLTRLPSYSVCRDNVFFLSVVDEVGGLGWEIVLYDSTNAVLSTGIFYPDSSSVQNIATLGCGLWQLRALSLIPSFWASAAPVVFTSAVARWSVKATAMPGNHALTAPFSLYLDDECCGYQFLFLNSFGVWEVLNVATEEQISYSINGETFLSPRASPADAAYLQSAQSRYLDKSGRNILTFILPESRDAYRDFYRDFLASPEVYLIEGVNLTPVQVQTGAFDIKRNHALAIQVDWANAETSQHR